MKQNLVKLLNNKFIKGGALLTVTNFLVGFLNYLFNSLSGKALGPAKYSEIVSMFSYLFILSVPMQVVSAEIIRRLGMKGESRFTVIKSWESWFWQKIFRWSFLLIPYWLSIIWLPRLTNLTLQSSLALLFILLFSLLSVFYTSTLLGLQLMLFYSLLVLISALIKLIGPILVLTKIGDVNLILILIVLSVAILSLAGKFFLNLAIKKVQPTTYPIEKRIFQIILSKSILIIFITAISMNILNNLDVIYVKKMFPAITAGVYGAWNLYAKIIFYVISPLLTASFIFFTAKEQQKNHFRTLLSVIFLFIIVGVACFLFYLWFPEFTILFIFNRQFLSIKPLLPYAAVFGITYCLISFISGYFVAQNSYKAIIIFPFILIYAVSLIIFGRGLQQVVNINVIISALIFLTYLILIFFESRTKKAS